RAWPDSASRRRHRNRRTKGPEGKASSSSRNLRLGKAAAGMHVETFATPMDGTAEQRAKENHERDGVAQGQKPKRPSLHAHEIVDAQLEHRARKKRRRQHAKRNGAEAEQQCCDEGERQRMDRARTDMARWIDAADGAVPAQFVTDQFAEALLGTGVIDDDVRKCERVALFAHGAADFIIVGKEAGEGMKAADLFQRLARERDGGAETGGGETGL